MDEFKKLGLSETTLKALQSKGISTPTPIQAQTIPLLLKGQKDVVGQSQTGTGKTASFALPMIELLQSKEYVQAIVLVPTRELAIQVSKEIDSLAQKRIHALAVYGGSPIGAQIRHLKKGVDIVVGTPGRVMDLMERGNLSLSKIKFAVLDEADEMLDRGFVDDMKKILQTSAKSKRVVLFSATMSKGVLQIAKRFMGDYHLVEVKSKQEKPLTDQIYYELNAQDRVEAIRRIVAMSDEFYGIIFCKTKIEVDQLARSLSSIYPAAALHGDISQDQREKILEQFRAKRLTILIATDVAARGIHVNNVSHVINYSLPQSPQSYVHRVGRTGRAGMKGTAITFLIPSERRGLRAIESEAKQKLRKAKVPSVHDIIQIKKEEIITRVREGANKQEFAKYQPLAESILEHANPLDALCMLIGMKFDTDLNESKFQALKPIQTYVERRESRKPRRGGPRRDSRREGSRSKESSSRFKRSDRRDSSRPRPRRR